jgi:hypothetical protein
VIDSTFYSKACGLPQTSNTYLRVVHWDDFHHIEIGFLVGGFKIA